MSVQERSWRIERGATAFPNEACQPVLRSIGAGPEATCGRLLTGRARLEKTMARDSYRSRLKVTDVPSAAGRDSSLSRAGFPSIGYHDSGPRPLTRNLACTF